MAKAFKIKTVPAPFQGGMAGVGPSRSVLKAGPKAVAAWEAMVAEAERDHAQRAKEQRQAERHSVEAHLAVVERQAAHRGEEAERTAAGPLMVSRDGLLWLMRKGGILRPHYEAGLRFRADYELANGTGVKSCLAEAGAVSAFGPKSGPSDAMLAARGRVRDALDGLGTPLLHAYVIMVAGEGEMLNGPGFVTDRRNAAEHALPCRVAFDLLARGYGMIR